MPVNKESEIVSNKKAEADQKATEQDRAKATADAHKAAKEQSAKLDKEFGSHGRADSRKVAEDRVKEIKQLLRDSIQQKKVVPDQKIDDAKAKLQDFSLALQEKRADLPNKHLMSVEEFNNFMNDLNMILQERDQQAASGEDTLRYVIEKIRTDAVA